MGDTSVVGPVVVVRGAFDAYIVWPLLITCLLASIIDETHMHMLVISNNKKISISNLKQYCG